MTAGMRVVVAGAGAFGGWSALALLRRGARVTLVDPWGPGNARASSGGETRAIRGIYGNAGVYTRWAARALELWREAEARWGERLYRSTGALWMCGDDDAYVRAALPHLSAHGLAVEPLEIGDAAERYPAVSFDGLSRVWLERDAGALFARRACRAVARAVAGEGGEVVARAARPAQVTGGVLSGVELSDGTRLEADAFVFACGPWLPELFGDALSPLAVSRQEVYYFGPPAGAGLESLPVWIDMTLGYYGLPPSEGRGFKVADDRRGPPFDPTSGDRAPTRDGVEAARAFLGRRFPALAGAPLVESRVCQYTNAPDGRLVIDVHPAASNLWLVGGGSGHGFKLGPVVGEVVAGHVIDGDPVDPGHAVARLARLGEPGPTIFD